MCSTLGPLSYSWRRSQSREDKLDPRPGDKEGKTLNRNSLHTEAFGLTPDESAFPGREAGGEGEGSVPGNGKGTCKDPDS